MWLSHCIQGNLEGHLYLKLTLAPQTQCPGADGGGGSAREHLFISTLIPQLNQKSDSSETTTLCGLTADGICPHVHSSEA